MHQHLGLDKRIEMAIALGGIVTVDGYVQPLSGGAGATASAASSSR